jgi:glycosyltransferase involved in cell wall biosynthesis
MVIAAVNASEQGGGAEAVARGLTEGLRGLGHEASLLVGRGAATGPHVHAFPDDAWTRLAHLLAGPGRLADRWSGLESYRYPATARMLRVLPGEPDLVHLHNLHGGYFDLRVLPALSRRIPVALTLHDAWLLSGHCAHSLGCERWRTGCGSCPDLDIYPAVRRDATARNWRRKRDIFRRARLHVATPSRWLADRVHASMLAPAVAELRVIPHGIDLAIFRPGDAGAARHRLGLDPDTPVLLFIGGATRGNPFRDRNAAEGAAVSAAERLGRDLTLLALGSDVPDRKIGRVAVRNLPFQPDPTVVAACHQAADLYLHPARADTFPSTVLEALACGTPVVATAVGGIPEQVRDVDGPGDATGALVAPGDSQALSAALVRLLEDAALRRRLGDGAARDAAERFAAATQHRAYAAWFEEIVAVRRTR